ncbi:GNAT family N-acetyltransferase [Pseudoflavitalea sp. G-6-1-2]|uniref:GNAT family N-acetyltransferase n=1 Tax=Pseudoflavitalea sp. G-6-1-2 TaxID=2728841 RepID=UPI00146AD038|nr:GNAT family N-acetyltransferase [Pseudoflavitalea sp. G-6-1-2]NML21361.1 GNAT family N-acetyltransferase [Pseudoflavitalea sp. G-6-1-2]
MESALLNQLNNPAWHALQSAQQSFAIGNDAVKRYKKNILPFAAYDHAQPERLQELDQYFQSGETFFLIGELPEVLPHWTLLNDLPCLQMVSTTPVPPIENAQVEIAPLTAADRDAMYQLIQKVQPGYYMPDTHQLGDYFGIWDDENLIAIAGERMRLNGLSELSAICTDPAHTGKKYAQHLIHHLCNSRRAMGITPMLHVLDTNERAVRLYEFLGFQTRKTIHFRKFLKP